MIISDDQVKMVLAHLRGAGTSACEGSTPCDGVPLELLERAAGTRLALGLRPRSRVSFKAWTEEGLERFDDVREVIETPDEYLVLRHWGRFPARVPRARVVRRQTDCERWFEVVEIERA